MWKNAAWQRTVAFLAALDLSALEPSSFSYTTVISVCGKAVTWQLARAPLAMLGSTALEPYTIHYNAAITAFERLPIGSELSCVRPS